MFVTAVGPAVVEVWVGVSAPFDCPELGTEDGTVAPPEPAEGGGAGFALGPALATLASDRGTNTGQLKTSPRTLTTLGKLAAEPTAMTRFGRREES